MPPAAQAPAKDQGADTMNAKQLADSIVKNHGFDKEGQAASALAMSAEQALSKHGGGSGNSFVDAVNQELAKNPNNTDHLKLEDNMPGGGSGGRNKEGGKHSTDAESGLFAVVNGKNQVEDAMPIAVQVDKNFDKTGKQVGEVDQYASLYGGGGGGWGKMQEGYQFKQLDLSGDIYGTSTSGGTGGGGGGKGGKGRPQG
jgi:hypothetical protein